MKNMLFLMLLTLGAAPFSFGLDEKPAVIITQDGEVDDRSSFVRLLLYSPDMNLRGVIATNSKWQKNGHGLGWLHEVYARYGQVRDNLLLHHPGYPSVEFLQSITVLGNEDPEQLTGAPPYADSEGADLIIKELLSSEENLLHINCWGGMNTAVHALWTARKNHPAEFAKRAPNVRLITIDFQDEAGDWMVEHMPEIKILRNNAFHMTWNYHSVDKPLRHNPYPNVMSKKWLYDHIKTNHGPLGAWYPQDNVSEGDTPAFLGAVDNGLKAYTDYSLGGWGGRYGAVRGNYWMDAQDDHNPHKTLWRWIPDIQNDFAARMDWCIKSYRDANHHPTLEEAVSPDAVKPGQTIALTAQASDPDGDNLYYYWWHYPDPSGMDQPIRIHHESSSDAHFVVPEQATKPIHIILEVQDDGSPSLKTYRRVIFPVDP
jgi:hypothetical protein